MLPWANFTAVHNTWDYKRVPPSQNTHFLFLISTSLGTHSHLGKNQQQMTRCIWQTTWVFSAWQQKKKKKIQTASSTQFSFSNNTVHTPKKEKRFKKKNIAKMIIVQMYYTCNILSWPVTTRSLKQSAPISVGLYGPTQVRATLVSRSQDKLLVSKHSS